MMREPSLGELVRVGGVKRFKSIPVQSWTVDGISREWPNEWFPSLSSAKGWSLSGHNRPRHLSSAQFQPVMEWRLSSNGKDCPRAGFAPLSPPWAGFIILATATGLFILRALRLFILCPGRGAACSGLLVGATWWQCCTSYR